MEFRFIWNAILHNIVKIINKSSTNVIFIILILSFNATITRAETIETEPQDYLLLDDNNRHQLRIEGYSWFFIAYDMVLVNKLISEGMAEPQAMEKAAYRDSVGKFRKNTEVNLTAMSRDVLRGFAINELDVQLTLRQAEPGNEWGPASQIIFTTPNKDISYTAYCHIYCGLGHSNEKIKIVIGEGGTSYGSWILQLFILINIGIFGKMALKTTTYLES